VHVYKQHGTGSNYKPIGVESSFDDDIMAEH